MIQIDVTSILSMMAGSISRMFGMDLLRWLAWKALIITVITVTLPIVLKNVITWLFETVMSIATSQISTNGLTHAAFEFTGFSGYLAYHLMIPESIAIILTGLAIRLVLNFIPFVG
ncbi:MAG: hypothetical protein HY885_07630 [Deltaproteobacteria bacterium]|nr:hypothetical protein [Deltaproteobacteria bacterium]